MSPILFVLVPILLLAVWLPGWWVRRTLQRYSEPADRYYGSGAMLARLLLDKHGLTHIAVEKSDTGDHYDLEARGRVRGSGVSAVRRPRFCPCRSAIAR